MGTPVPAVPSTYSTSYEEFAAEHRAQHLSPFIRWSPVVGNYSLVPTAIALLFSRIRTDHLTNDNT
jgi:hypothetical protein